MWWLRSVSCLTSNKYTFVTSNGSYNEYAATYSFGLAPAFMVGGNAA